MSLIDSVIELTTENDSMNLNLDNLSENRDVMTMRIFVIEEQLVVLESEKSIGLND